MSSEVSHENRAHFKNGGSQIGRRIQCPGSLRMEDKVPEEVEASEHAQEGTYVHECIESLIPVAIKNRIAQLNGESTSLYSGAPKLLSYDAEHIDSAKLAVDNILNLMGEGIAGMGWAAEHKYIRSRELQLGGTADMTWAYVDAEGVRHAHIWDYKNGVIPVNAKKTPQLLSYACALQHITLEKKRPPFDIIHTHIFQPNSQDEENTYSSQSYTKEEIAEADKRFIEVAEIALGLHGDPPMRLRSGEYCHYCRAKAICPEYRKSQTDKAIEVFNTTEDPDVEVLEDFQDTDIIPVMPAGDDPAEIVKTLTDEQIVQFFKHRKFLTDAIKATESYIKLRATSGNPVKGLKCVEGTGRRGWRKDLSVPKAGKLLKDIGIAAPWEKKLVTISHAEQVLKESGMTLEQAKEALSPAIEVGKSPISIVFDDGSDTRPAIEGLSKEKISAALKEADLV